MTIHYALTKVYAPGTSHETEDRADMKAIFKDAYTEAVFAKMRWNGFDLNAFEVEESSRQIRIPNCMKKKSLRSFGNQVNQNNEEEYNIACNSYMHYDEEAEIQEALKSGEFNTKHPVMKRAAKESSQNIKVMFKKIKKENEKK